MADGDPMTTPTYPSTDHLTILTATLTAWQRDAADELARRRRVAAGGPSGQIAGVPRLGGWSLPSLIQIEREARHALEAAAAAAEHQAIAEDQARRPMDWSALALEDNQTPPAECAGHHAGPFWCLCSIPGVPPDNRRRCGACGKVLSERESLRSILLGAVDTKEQTP